MPPKRPNALLDRRIVSAPDDKTMRHTIDITLREHRAAIQALQNTVGETDDEVIDIAARVATATAALTLFTDILDGIVPASGGGTTNFLRADGTWAAPAGGGGGGIDDTLALGALL